jgi:hypothetical protein
LVNRLCFTKNITNDLFLGAFHGLQADLEVRSLGQAARVVDFQNKNVSRFRVFSVWWRGDKNFEKKEVKSVYVNEREGRVFQYMTAYH